MDIQDEIKLALLISLRMQVTESGELYEIKKLVDRIDNIQIRIHPRDHNPPHFHVKTNNINASFSILNEDLIKGTINAKDQKRIKYFYQSKKEKLIKIWEDLRTDLIIK